MAVAVYQQRHPQSTILYFLVESLYEKVKAVWEQRFERSYGFWRGFVDDDQAELLFRHKVFKLLENRGLLSEERIELLLSWRHTGFSVDNSITVYPSDEQGLERLARYMIRSPVSLQRLNYLPQTQQVFYQTKYPGS